MIAKQTLRDRKKEATASALAEAAFELALEKGLDGFVVDDVVQQAGYSRRTFANYFSCKEEAVAAVAVPTTSVEEYEKLLAGLPQGATPLDVLYSLMQMQFTAEFLLKIRKFISLSKQYPTLEPYILGVFRRLQMAAQEALEPFARGRYKDGYTHLLVGAVYGAFVPILDGSLNVLLLGETEAEPTAAIPFDQYLNSMFEYLRKGF
ncbi:TetR/AcrR family transcriptional regulator [Paenibacillus sp. Leaf72]|uniref:TetR/AcrR family transcriptional regulator n=1 Tax=Paenibacillus sp. Leaf72 TaxID=1736234 RepID=UPI000AD4F20D|nr:TetR/AcrR family transcriptional regulator [Paenibacillus sp. Leaf72]